MKKKIIEHLSCDPEVIIDQLFVRIKKLEQKLESTEEYQVSQFVIEWSSLTYLQWSAGLL